MSKKYITSVILILLLFTTTNISAQCGPCPPGQQCNVARGRCVPVGPGLPIDGGLAILIAAGVALGIKKLRD